MNVTLLNALEIAKAEAMDVGAFFSLLPLDSTFFLCLIFIFKPKNLKLDSHAEKKDLSNNRVG